MIAKLSRLAAMACILYGLASAEDASEPPTPDHLVPLRPYPEDWEVAYTKQLTKYLGLREVYLARMIVKPSFGAEYLMRIHGDKESSAFDDSKKYFVTCTVSDKSIWYSMPNNNDKKIQKPIRPKTFTASIPAETARRVCRIWDEMIFRTHYPREWSAGLDGVTIEFASRYGHGEAWCPTDGTSPALLLELGERLIAYCKVAVGQDQHVGTFAGCLYGGQGRGDSFQVDSIVRCDAEEVIVSGAAENQWGSCRSGGKAGAQHQAHEDDHGRIDTRSGLAWLRFFGGSLVAN